MVRPGFFDRSASSANQNMGTSATSNRGASQVGGQASQHKTPLSTGSNNFFLLIASIYIRFPKDPGNANYKFSLNGSRSEEHTSELQSLMRISYAVFCLKKKKTHK